MRDQVLGQLREAIDATAATFDGRGSPIKERELEMAVETAVRTLGFAPVRQFPLRLEEAWCGRVGGVDLALHAREGSPIFIELKWDPNTLAACAWDSMKLAAALQAGEGERAFLVAGSPHPSAGLRGNELLDDAEVDAIGLRREYAKEFDYWKADVKNHPVRAPASWRVRARHSASLHYREAPWRLRIAELELMSRELSPVE
jgi:hypothetical protein